jgi:hypothetical protein
MAKWYILAILYNAIACRLETIFYTSWRRNKQLRGMVKPLRWAVLIEESSVYILTYNIF